MLKALFKGKDDELTCASAIEIAIKTEDTAKVAKETLHGPHLNQGINKIQPNRKRKSAKPGQNPKECRFKRTTCHYCSKIGHLKVVCLKEKRDSNILRGERRKTQQIFTISKPTAINKIQVPELHLQHRSRRQLSWQKCLEYTGETGTRGTLPAL